MNTKIVIKTIGALFVLTIVFLAGFYASGAYQIFEAIGAPHIVSETQVRGWISSKMPLDLPDNTVHLYYAGCGFVDADHYAALSLPSTEECERYIKEEFERGLDMRFKDFVKTSQLPDAFAKRGPDTWEREYQDPLWDLSEVNDFFLYTGLMEVVYVPEKCRFYIHY